jgi:adenine-specific DNA-methyltransferase
VSVLLFTLAPATGSIFVQIGHENLHRVRDVLDEVFGSTNSLGLGVVNK